MASFWTLAIFAGRDNDAADEERTRDILGLGLGRFE
jgi:hypothetical protein